MNYTRGGECCQELEGSILDCVENIAKKIYGGFKKFTSGLLGTPLGGR